MLNAGGGAWQQAGMVAEQEADRSHLNHTQEAEGQLEVGQGYKLSELAPSDLLPPGGSTS